MEWRKNDPGDFEKNTTPTDRTIIYGIVIVPMILLFGFVFWSAYTGKSTDELILEDDLAEDFSGRVDTMYFETQNHNIKVAMLANKYRYEIYSLWERNIEIGDSISKKKGSLKLDIYKKGNTKITLDYRDTYKK